MARRMLVLAGALTAAAAAVTPVQALFAPRLASAGCGRG
jgi:hypothetical protein